MAASRLNCAGALDLPATIAVSTVVEKNLVFLWIVIKPGTFGRKLCQGLGWLMLGEFVQ